MFCAGLLLSNTLSTLRSRSLQVLVPVSFLAALTGFLTIQFSVKTAANAASHAARLGARSGLFSSLLCAGMIVLALKLVDAAGLFAAWLAAPLCILPGALAGMAGASLAVSFAPSPIETERDKFVDVPADGISWLAFPIWMLALLGLTSPIYLRSWKGYFPPPVASNPIAPQPAPAPRPANIPEPPPSPPPFRFTPSPELGTAKPLQWELATHQTLTGLSGDGPLAFTADGRWIAGLAGGDVAMFDLHSLESECTWKPRIKVRSLAFSPDGRQLFLVSDESPPRVGVLRRDGARVIMLPQPRNRLVPADPPIWLGTNDVIFLSSGEVPARLDLATLEIGPAATTESWQGRSNTQLEKWTVQGQPIWPERSAWRLAPVQFSTATELPEVEGAKSGWPERHELALAIIDQTRAPSKAFPSVGLAIGDRFLASQDGSKFVRCRGRDVEVFYLIPSSKVPQSSWSVTMPDDPKTLEEPALKRAVEERHLCAFAYRPLVNPLNNEVIGPDRRRVIASVRIAKWEGSQAICVSDIQSEDPAGPLVIADPHRWNGIHPELLRLPIPHRWWSIAKPAELSSQSGSLPALNNQPRVETRFEGGAFSIVDIREPEPPSLPRPQAPPPTQSPAPAPQEPAAAAPPERPGEPVYKFVLEHHRKTSAGDFAGIAADYADRVEYLKNGTVSRAFIEQDARKYHQEHRNVREWSPGEMVIRKKGPDRYEAEYVLHSETTLVKDGTTSKVTIPLRLVIVRQNGEFKIIKQVRDPSIR